MNTPVTLSAALAALVLLAVPAHAEVDWPRMAESGDGTLISYEVHGRGDTTLVLVHGWSCDGRYWREQVPHFSSDYRVVVVDLAGHGHSGLGRAEYTMSAFGQDVKAVVDELDAERVILVGHSMGGPVSVSAARLMPNRVAGIVGVDTFQDIGERITQEEADQWLAPLQADFRSGASQFVPQMFRESTDAALRDWVIADMSAAPPHVAVSAMEHMLADAISGEALAAFDGLDVPVVTINADLFPTDVAANREHLPAFEAVIIEDADHFLHMALPDAFNRALETAIAEMR